MAAAQTGCDTHLLLDRLHMSLISQLSGIKAVVLEIADIGLAAAASGALYSVTGVAAKRRC
jgi:hypothetical protein